MNLLTRLKAFYGFCDTSALLLNKPHKIACALAQQALKRYEDGCVLDYELGCAPFAGRFYACNEHTLVPREDSLVLLSAVMGFIAQENRPLRLLEIGAGTGILSISLALATKDRFNKDYININLSKALLNIDACDISAKALEIARINCAAARVRINLIHSDFRDLDFSKYDLVFSNPPYIANNYALDSRVRKEPALALFGGELGSEIIEQIIAKAAAAKVRAIACEIGYDQRLICEKLLKQSGFKASFYRDLANLDRAFLAIRNIE